MIEYSGVPLTTPDKQATRSAKRAYRVLLIAEAANPEWTSVPLIGWSLARALAKVADVHLVTQIRNRDAILRAGLIEGRDFTAIDNEHVAARLHKLATLLRGGAGKGWTTGTALSSLAYYSFERAIWREFGARLAAREFDLVHRITPLSPTSPSIIASRLANIKIPFIVGPLNGGVPWPRHFINRRRAEREWLSSIRWLYKLMPGYRSMRRHSAAILVGSKFTAGEMPDWARSKCIYIPENGVDLQRFSRPRDHRAALPLRAAFVGRLVPYKGADMLLEAAAEFLKDGQLKLEIVGDGPQRPQLESMVDRLDIRANVRLHGWLPHAQVPEILRHCDFLALPSVREFGGGVVLESMALGIAPVVADYAGPSELVDEQTGVRVPFSDKQSLVDGMRRTIGEFVCQPDILDRLGAAGREMVLDKMTWEAKANQIVAIYNAVLTESNDLPSFGHR
jgi:glycosyltransferase involved in cell wall biosynthesis